MCASLYLSKQSSAVLSSEYSWQLALVPRESMRVPSAKFVRADIIEKYQCGICFASHNSLPLVACIVVPRALVVCLYHEGI